MQLLCRDVNRKRDFSVEEGTRVTSDVSSITQDTSLDMVVELTGDHTTSKALFDSAYDKGQVLVTANKSYLAANLSDRRLRSNAFKLGYEAAVGGGIPIIRAMQSSLIVDAPTSVAGIMNGTTNFILSSMASGGQSYADALKAAQACGFAEADPTADVEGHDARNKLVLLTHLAYGTVIAPEKVRTTGITSVSAEDFAAVRGYGATVKLLGVAKLFDAPAPAASSSSASAASSSSASSSPLQQKLLDVFVSPVIVPSASAFGTTNGGMNLFRVESSALGVSEYYGPGAGRFATANSVLADMAAFAQRKAYATKAFPRPQPRALGFSVKNSDTFARRFYVRGPEAIVKRASLALWRQDIDVTTLPRSSSSSSAASKEAAFVSGPISYRSLSSMLRVLENDYRKSAGAAQGAAGTGAGAAEGAAQAQKRLCVTFPVWDGVQI